MLFDKDTASASRSLLPFSPPGWNVGSWPLSRRRRLSAPLTVPAAQQLLRSRARITQKFALCRNRFHFSGIECEKNQGGGEKNNSFCVMFTDMSCLGEGRV